MTELTSERLRELLDYDPETGVFTNRFSRGAAKAGAVAGRSIGSSGYLRIMVSGRHYLAHRLAWLYMTGEWPKEEVDHINRDKIDNRWANLREATRTDNAINQIRSSRALPRGVRRAKSRFQASLKVDGQFVHLGNYATPEEAHAAYLDADKRFRSGFAPKASPL